ncbi:MAG: FkbM family methyltransferase [Pseudomonadota bacterium]
MSLGAALRKLGLFAIELLSRAGHIDLRPIVYRKMGIMQWQNSVISGERYLITEVLTKAVSRENYSVFFDIGSNEGNYAQELLDSFPNAEIHCFEPNPAQASRLKQRFHDHGNVKIVECAISDENADELELYDYAISDGSQHASLYKGVLTDQHKAAAVKSHAVRARKIDDYCQETGVTHVNFLKIDVEGHEFAALCGAKELLRKGSIDLIQFEFNQMNVYSRTFLKDYYDLLPDFGFYRLRKDGLIRMQNYSARNEIFRFQNILAVAPKFREMTDNLRITNIW